jgi:hypothetical protein
LLTGGVVVVGGGLAGCSSSPLGGGCDGMHRSEIEAERESPPAEERDALVPIRVADLPSAERDIALQVVRSGDHSECSPESEAFESLLDRISDHRYEQQKRSDADLTTVYFLHEERHYALTAMELDQMISY